MKNLPGWFFFLIIVVVPVLFSVVTIPLSFHRSKTVRFCASCHSMAPFVESLKNPKEQALATKHYQRRWVAHDQCATCHTDYDFLGPVNAKIRGIRHLVTYYLAPHGRPKLYKPYKNINCLQCHEGTQAFVDNPLHMSSLEQIQKDEVKCLDCHRPIHPESITTQEKQ